MVLIETELREVTTEPLEPNAGIIRRSFQTVADEMGITVDNAPRYTAFITGEHLGEERDHGAVFYGCFIDGVQAGFVTLEPEPDGRWHMKRLAVLPEYRSYGVGRKLVDHVVTEARSRGVKWLHIGIVNEQAGLKDWYMRLGFREYEVFEIPDLPFTVSLLKKDLRDTNGG